MTVTKLSWSSQAIGALDLGIGRATGGELPRRRRNGIALSRWSGQVVEVSGWKGSFLLPGDMLLLGNYPSRTALGSLLCKEHWLRVGISAELVGRRRRRIRLAFQDLGVSGGSVIVVVSNTS